MTVLSLTSHNDSGRGVAEGRAPVPVDMTIACVHDVRVVWVCPVCNSRHSAAGYNRHVRQHHDINPMIPIGEQIPPEMMLNLLPAVTELLRRQIEARMVAG